MTYTNPSQTFCFLPDFSHTIFAFPDSPRFSRKIDIIIIII